MKRMKYIMIAAGSALALISVPAFGQGADMKMGEMKGMKMDGMSCCNDMAPGFGVVNSVDLDARKVNLTHDPIEKIGWGGMSMDFKIGDMVALSKFEKGDNVHFMLKKNDDGAFDVAMMTPIGGDPAAFKQVMKSMMGVGMISCDGMMGDMDHMPEMQKNPDTNDN